MQLNVEVTCNLTNKVHKNVYASMAHLQQVLMTNAEVDSFGSGRNIVPSGSPDINGNNMYWEWIFADTGEPAYQIEIERIVEEPKPLTEIETLKDDIVVNGASIIEAYEGVDLDKMTAEGYGVLAGQIRAVLALVDVIQMQMADD
jgi:hypothetical protein